MPDYYVTFAQGNQIESNRGKLSHGVVIHHDNAPAHHSVVIQDALHANGFTFMGHPPYSPDLAPADFALFSEMKNAIRGREFSCRSSLGSALYQWYSQLSEEWFTDVFRKWVRRWDHCVELSGDYIEKQ